MMSTQPWRRALADVSYTLHRTVVVRRAGAERRPVDDRCRRVDKELFPRLLKSGSRISRGLPLGSGP